MPRIPLALFWAARRISPAAPLLLPVCRDLASVRAELRWISEAVGGTNEGHCKDARRLLHLCRRRGRGEPLQYVLGTQPFGSLDLRCRRGVLIPRPEPEAYTLHLSRVLAALASSAASLTILDACTGSGCIALLLYAQLRAPAERQGWRLRVVGVDVAPAAVALARENRSRNALGGGDSHVRFFRADLFDDAALLRRIGAHVDVLVSNPPYVSADGFAHDTARSVRLFEPKRAQVPEVALAPADCPDHPEDAFYVRLLALAARLGARILLCEVGGLEQARRVAAMAGRQQQQQPRRLCELEIWADCPDAVDHDGPRTVVVYGRVVPVRGSGHGRAVFVRWEKDPEKE